MQQDALWAAIRQLQMRITRIEQHLADIAERVAGRGVPPQEAGAPSPVESAEQLDEQIRKAAAFRRLVTPESPTPTPTQKKTPLQPPPPAPPTGPAVLASPVPESWSRLKAAGLEIGPTPAAAPLPDEVGTVAEVEFIDDEPPRGPGAPSASRPRSFATINNVPLERIIAERWMAWVGALIVILAVGFFIKLAYDRGWISLSPLGKCIAAAVFGGALTVAGEVARKRVNRYAAVGLFGAGLGTLYLTAFAAFRIFDLVPYMAAFWLMFCVALLGIAITVRGRLVEIGVLSLLGGYLSPVLLAGETVNPAALPIYLTALLVIALILSAMDVKTFRPLRYVAAALHGVVAMLWVLADGWHYSFLTLAFGALWWLAIDAEALWAALRGQSSIGNPVIALGATIWYCAVGSGVLAATGGAANHWIGTFLLCPALICTLIAMMFGPGLAVLRTPPKVALAKFVVVQWTLAGTLVAASIGAEFRGENNSFGQTIGWLGLAAATIEMGRRLPSRGVTVFAVIVALLALSRAWTVDPRLPVLRTVFWNAGDLHLTYWAAIGAGAIAVSTWISMRTRLRGLQVLFFVLVTVQWLVFWVRQADHLVSTACWLAGPALVFAWEEFRIRTADARGRTWALPIGWRGIALAALLLTGLRWLAVDALDTRLRPGWSPLTLDPFVNWQAALALGIAAVAWFAARTRAPVESMTGGMAAFERSATDAALSAASPMPVMLEKSRAAITALTPQLTLIAAFGVVAAAIGFEIDRVIGRVFLNFVALKPRGWLPDEVRTLWFELTAAVIGIALGAYGLRRRMPALVGVGAFAAIAAACAWLASTLVWRNTSGVAVVPVVMNQQFGLGAAIAVLLMFGARLTERWRTAFVALLPSTPELAYLGLIIVGLIGIWEGSFEIDRYFHVQQLPAEDADMATQAGLSVFWAIYGVGVLALGFWQRTAAIRYGGLALLGITAAKVLLIDLSNVAYIYRVLSMLGVGLLFLGTSVAYSKLAARLGTRDEAPNGGENPVGGLPPSTE